MSPYSVRNSQCIDDLVQERRNSIANALELRLSYTNASVFTMDTCTGLIKSNRPLFQLHFSGTYIWGKYLIFGKTLDKMLHFQYILKLITCHASFRSSDTKQWHTLWIGKSSFKRVTGSISRVYHGLLSMSEMRRTSIAKHYQDIDLKEAHCIIVSSSTRLGFSV